MSFTETHTQQTGSAHDARDDSYDPLAGARAKLKGAVEAHPSLKPVIAHYAEALQLGGMNDMGDARSKVDTALKGAGFDYMDRLDMLRVAQDEAAKAKQTGVTRTLVKQVAERHEGG